MKPKQNSIEPEAEQEDSTTSSRREFLRKSVYAAYATPFITTLLVAKKSAAGSFDCYKHPDHWKCQ